MQAYLLTGDRILTEVNIKAKILFTNLGLADRTEPIVSKIPGITLICPNSSDLGKVSKFILDKYLNNLRKKIELNLWSNTWEALDWFNKIGNKKDWKFIQIDIDDYYPSINEVVLNKTLLLAKNKLGMSRVEIDLVKVARIAILKFKDKLWIRKGTRDGFHIAIGASDSAEAIGLVGLYLLNELNTQIPELKGWLYRDDGLILLHRPTTRQLELYKKKLFQFFKREGLKN